MRPRILVAEMDVLVSIEEDYCLKGKHFAICRPGKHHSLYLKVSF